MAYSKPEVEVDSALFDDFRERISVFLDPKDDGERGVVVYTCRNAAQPAMDITGKALKKLSTTGGKDLTSKDIKNKTVQVRGSGFIANCYGSKFSRFRAKQRKKHNRNSKYQS
jgi:hypothetical protein